MINIHRVNLGSLSLVRFVYIASFFVVVVGGGGVAVVGFFVCGFMIRWINRCSLCFVSADTVHVTVWRVDGTRVLRIMVGFLRARQEIDVVVVLDRTQFFFFSVDVYLVVLSKKKKTVLRKHSSIPFFVFFCLCLH